MKIQACLIVLVLVGATAVQSKYASCPFKHVYHFGDGFTDIGNSIYVHPFQAPNPAAIYPYGISSPGYPTGRWSDGLTDFDFAATDFGLPRIVPYLQMNASEEYDGVIFSVARSPILDISFFESKGINIPRYAHVPLSAQVTWFKKYFKSIYSTSQECRNRLKDSLLLLGDIQGNDIGYALSQGKSIQEVRSYVPLVIEAQMTAAREFIKMGARLMIIPGNAPLGCYPYILTALHSTDRKAYDDLGCLKSVNNLILKKNDMLLKALGKLRLEFPDVTINYGAIYDGAMQLIRDTSSGPNGKLALKACCGIGGEYNYDNERFCGSQSVPVCPYPNQYIFWDGFHFTHQAYSHMETIMIAPALVKLGCTVNSNKILNFGGIGYMNYVFGTIIFIITMYATKSVFLYYF